MVIRTGLGMFLTLLGTIAAQTTVAQTELSVVPSSATVPFGTTFTVDVDISNVSNLYGYQFDLSFNPKVLDAVSSTEGSFLSKGGTTFFIPGTNDNTTGQVAGTADTLIGNVPGGVSGKGVLAVITFDAIGKGVSNLSLSGTTLVNSNLGIISSASIGSSIGVGSALHVPEIDSSSAAAALTVLLGTLVLLRERFGRARS